MTENRRALIVASYQYQDPDLRQLVAPAQDAEDLALVLRDPAIGGFDQVETSINQPSHDVRRAIACFFAQGARKDLLLLYFSGHGLLDAQGHLYLAAQDTERDLLSATAIPAVFVSAEMDRSRSRRQVLVLDCCHSGAFDRGTKGAVGTRVGTAAAFEGTGYGRIVLTATDSTQYAWEGDQVIGQADHSVFTHYLVHGLQTGEADTDADGLITLDELYDYVYAQVVRETPRQTPGKWTYKQQGEILIARNPHWVIKPAELPTELQQAIESTFTGIREGAVSELERLLHSSDEGLALAARQALTILANDDSRRVSAAAARALGTAPASVQTPREAPPPPAPRITPRKTEPTRPQPETAQYKTLSSDRVLWKKDGKEMVHVPAGKFLYGDEKEERDLPEFWIDKTPVTNAEYARFVEATGHKSPKHWKGKTPPKKIINHPVVNVNWHDAVAYAEWAGKRLPTEGEWEKAARGTDGRKYPWGDNAPTPELCNFSQSALVAIINMVRSNTTPVGRHSPQGDSPYGCVDMAGNVWEWTASDYDKDRKVLRGGSFSNVETLVRASHRNADTPADRYSHVGFRCVGVAPGQ